MLAIIGGSGLYSLGEEFEVETQVTRNTVFGNTSSDILIGTWNTVNVAFLPRHGPGHQVPPHRINYRANIWALHEQGVKRIIAVNAVGGITENMPPASLVLPDQIIDYSSGREASFFDGEDGEARHVDFTWPYSRELRGIIEAAARQTGTDLVTTATYACTNGPRLETAAEISRLRRDGCHIVGMTGMPEAVLARELEMEYASLALVVNWAAGIHDQSIRMEEVLANLEQGLQQLKPLLYASLGRAEE